MNQGRVLALERSQDAGAQPALELRVGPREVSRTGAEVRAAERGAVDLGHINFDKKATEERTANPSGSRLPERTKRWKRQGTMHWRALFVQRANASDFRLEGSGC